MDFPSEGGHYLKIRFYLSLLKAVLLNGMTLSSEKLGWKSFLFLALILSKAKDKQRLKTQLTAPSARPLLRHLAYNIFMISQRTECSLEASGDDLQIEITKKGIAYTFRFIGLPNRAKAPFVHNLTPLTDIFFLDLYDLYDYRGGVVIDIGAYIGDTAAYFAKNGASQVYSYEPNPINYEYLKKNIDLNGVAGSVKTFNYAVSIERRLLVVPDKAGAGSVYSRSEAGASYDVGNVRPNDLLHDLPAVSLLKVDCKGCERELLFGESINEISKKVRCLIIDAGTLNSKERDEMISEVERAGFSSDSGPSEALYFRNQRLRE